MAVKVTKPNGEASKYSQGNGIRVEDGGHLFVTNGLDVVAIYAPGKWTRAEQYEDQK